MSWWTWLRTIEAGASIYRICTALGYRMPDCPRKRQGPISRQVMRPSPPVASTQDVPHAFGVAEERYPCSFVPNQSVLGRKIVTVFSSILPHLWFITLFPLPRPLVRGARVTFKPRFCGRVVLQTRRLTVDDRRQPYGDWLRSMARLIRWAYPNPSKMSRPCY
jgi:hypothetical protein